MKPKLGRKKKGRAKRWMTMSCTIEQLVSEEQGLWQREAEGATAAEERRRLER